MINLVAESTLQDKLIKDIRNSKDIILAERSRQTRGADVIKMKISSLLQGASLLFFPGDTVNIEIKLSPDDGVLSIWDFLWQFLEHDSPTPSTVWHWPEEINGAGRKVSKDFSINWTLDFGKSADGIGRRNLYFRIKNLTGDTKFGAFAIKGYVLQPEGELTGSIAGV